jgi:hypothetical protein
LTVRYFYPNRVASLLAERRPRDERFGRCCCSSQADQRPVGLRTNCPQVVLERGQDSSQLVLSTASEAALRARRRISLPAVVARLFRLRRESEIVSSSAFRGRFPAPSSVERLWINRVRKLGLGPCGDGVPPARDAERSNENWSSLLRSSRRGPLVVRLWGAPRASADTCVCSFVGAIRALSVVRRSGDSSRRSSPRSARAMAPASNRTVWHHHGPRTRRRSALEWRSRFQIFSSERTKDRSPAFLRKRGF